MKKTTEKFGFKIGDEVINVGSNFHFNRGRFAKVVGFHSHSDAVFVVYKDGSYGMCPQSGNYYFKIVRK